MAGEEKGRDGVGMPAKLLLDEFGNQVWHAFGSLPYLVGSALTSTTWRDIDIRLILEDKEFADLDLGEMDRCHSNGKWVSLVLAYSALGKQLTGLPIDFQIQQQTWANAKYPSQLRNPIGLVALRFTDKREAAMAKGEIKVYSDSWFGFVEQLVTDICDDLTWREGTTLFACLHKTQREAFRAQLQDMVKTSAALLPYDKPTVAKQIAQGLVKLAREQLDWGFSHLPALKVAQAFNTWESIALKNLP